MNTEEVKKAAIGSLVQNLGSLIPLGAALAGIVLWLNSEFRAMERATEANRLEIITLRWCMVARESNPEFKCPPIEVRR